MQQVDPILDARQTVGDLPEVAPPKLLLAVEVERAMVGRHELQVVLDEAGPQVVPGLLRAQGRGAHELGALEPVAHVIERQEEVLRAGLGERLRAPVARGADLGQRIARRQVDDVDRNAGRLGQADDPVGRLALEDRLAGDAVADRVGHPGRDRLRGDDIDGHPVLGVHHDQPAVLRGLLHRPEDRPVVAVEDARVGGEQLEVGDAFGDEAVHLGQRVVVDVAHDHVEAVVGDGVAFRLCVPGVEPCAQRRALRLDREVDDRGRPAEGGRARPRLEGVLGERPAERQLHVGMGVDAARDDVPAGRVDGLVRGHPSAARSRPIWTMVSPSMRTSAAVEPSAVTIVPFVISVRIDPLLCDGSAERQPTGWEA